MGIDRIVMAFAGVLILVGVALTHFVSPWFLLLPAFVGVNFLQAAVTRFCPLAIILKKLGAKPECAFR